MLDKIKKLISLYLTSFHYARECSKYGGLKKINIVYLSKNELLCGKNILITGGGSGIGFAIAQRCINSGGKVVITGRNEEKLKEALNILGSDYAHYIVWDISKVDEIKSHLKEVRKSFGGDVDILINNAGIAPSKFWGNTNEEEWNKIYNTNLKGGFFLTQQITKDWKNYEHLEYKKIINISSQGGFVGATYPYRMVKWDIRGLTEGLGKSLINDRIIVNGIAPGIVKTSMQEFSLHQGDNLYTNQNPIHRVCLPEEIAELALFLMSDRSNFIIGQTIVCDGGYTLK